jgi:uridine phosphorylase
MEDNEFILTPKTLLTEFLNNQGVTLDQIDLPSQAALAFQHEGFAHLIDLSEAKPIGDWLFPIIDEPIYQGMYKGKTIVISKIPAGAPNAIAFVECLISLGVTRIIVTGAAGSIHPDARAGYMVIPTQAIREEGTSYCYYDGSVKVHASKPLVKLLQGAATQNHQRVICGTTWTTDGVFRESVQKMKEYSNQGVLTVEMEMSALFALAMFRKIDMAGLLIISDTNFDGHKIVMFNHEYHLAQKDAAKIILEALCAS